MFVFLLISRLIEITALLAVQHGVIHTLHDASCFAFVSMNRPFEANNILAYRDVARFWLKQH